MWCIVSSVGVVGHQGGELMTMTLRTRGFHSIFYLPGSGMGSICLTLIGFGIVITNLKIPLLWVQISSTSMDKAKGDRKKIIAFRAANMASVFFVVTFLLGAFLVSIDAMALYSTVWFFGFLCTYNYGGGKIRNQLKKMDSSGKYKVVIDSIQEYSNFYSIAVSTAAIPCMPAANFVHACC